MPPAKPAPDEEARPGRALKAIRKRRGWTLAAVSERTGLPISTLSKIENDKMSVSYDKLTRLCAGLEIDFADLLATESSSSAGTVSGRRSVTRAGEGRLIDTGGYVHRYHAAELLQKRFVPLVAEIRARSREELGDWIRHPGEEFAYVLEGSVDLHTEFYAPTRLETGESIYFDSGMGHLYVAATPGPCKVLGICSASESQLLEAITGNPAAAELVSTRRRPSKATARAPRGKRRRS
jgi:transcriptional regulator with XRE-family HTH domain